jgi:ATP-dependent Clp protease ATP-binding subunit ClpC
MVSTSLCLTTHPEACQAYLDAEKLAEQMGQRLTTGHVLLALFSFPNGAQELLAERHIERHQLVASLLPSLSEAPRGVRRLQQRAALVAEQAGADRLASLHILVAITRMRHSVGHGVLTQVAGGGMARLRNLALEKMMRPQKRPTKKSNLRVATKKPSLGTEQRATASGPTQRAAASLRTDHQAQLEAWRKAQLESGRQAHREALFGRPPATDLPAPQVDDDLAVPTSMPLTMPLPLPPAPARQAAPKPALPVAGLLQQFCVDLVAQAAANGLDAAIGRAAELQVLIDVLGKRRANNPVLVGPPGVGKTAIVEGLAVKIHRRDPDVAALFDCRILALDAGALLAGTSLRGALSERLRGIKAEVAAANRHIIVFIDEIHTLLGSTAAGDAAQDATEELKVALARGEFPCIGATTDAEFRRSIGRDPALDRRFSRIDVAEPDLPTARAIVAGSMGAYARHHHLEFTPEAIDAAVSLTHRFVDDRQLPDKAFAALDLAGSRSRRRGAQQVCRADVAEVVSQWSGVPKERLMEADASRLLQLETTLRAELVGHPEIIARVAHAVRRGFAGFSSRRPMSSMLLLGPTGVGKTELCRCLAHFMFGRRDAMVRLDMSELSERHSVARLIGAQPGYVGFEEGGQLTEALRRRPFQLVLFDEIDKAHPDVLNLLLQILDEGSLTDSRGDTVSFRHTLVLLTANLGAADVAPGRVGFAQAHPSSNKADEADDAEAAARSLAADDQARSAMLRAAQASLSPELWGRLDEHLAFLPLRPQHIAEIASLQLQACAAALQAQRDLKLSWSPEVPDLLMQAQRAAKGSGARGLRQIMARLVEAPLAELFLEGKVGPAHHLWLAPDGAGGLAIRRLPRAGTVELTAP